MSDNLEKIIQRTNELLRMERCIPRLVSRLGEREKYEEHNCYTTQTIALRGHNGFDFFYSGVFAKFGGENITIRYGDREVLNFDYWDSDRPRVRTYDPVGDWEPLLSTILTEEEQLMQREQEAYVTEREKSEIEKVRNKLETLAANNPEKFRRILSARARDLGSYLQ
jgi:hypothetical protein